MNKQNHKQHGQRDRPTTKHALATQTTGHQQRRGGYGREHTNKKPEEWNTDDRAWKKGY